MKRYEFYLLAAGTTFICGISLTAFWSFYLERKIEMNEIPQISQKCFLRFERANNLESELPSKINKLYPNPKKDSEEYDNIIDTLEKLVAFKNKQGTQTFNIAKIKSEGGREFSYGYWKEDNSIYVLNSVDQTIDDIDWFDYKCRIDLKTQVVPKGKRGNLGCCSVEDDWANKILADCKKGYKLTIKK